MTPSFSSACFALAERYERGLHVGPWFGQAKVDGVRALAVRGAEGGVELVLRSGHVLSRDCALCRELADLPEGYCLDGELVVSGANFEDTLAAVRRRDMAALRFVAFDLFRPGELRRYRLRRDDLLRYVEGKTWVEPVLQWPGMLAEDCDVSQALAEMLALGYEGLILRRDVPWEPGQSSDLLKVKPYCDREFEVLELNRRGRYSTTATLKAENGLRFKVVVPCAVEVGALVTVRYDGFTARGVPRFARFIAVRDYE